MTKEEAEKYADDMTYRDAINNLMKARSIPYRKATFIKVNALLKALEQEPCEDAISRKSLKQKLQEHHDFFVNAYGGFSNLSRNDKSRVDEISNCIAMVINEPPVTPQQKIGYWLRWYERKETEQYRENIPHCNCSECGKEYDPHSSQFIKFCSNCGARMQEA